MKRASLRSFGLASLFLVGTAMAACGTDTTGVFASGEPGTGASGGTGGQGGNGGDGGAGNGGAGTGGVGNGGSGTGGAGNGGSGTGGAGNGSSSSSSAQSSSSGPMPPPVMVTCGDVLCPVEGQSACCWDEYEFNAAPRGECVTGPDDNDNCATDFGNPDQGVPGFETRIECQIPAHCPEGTVCCGELTQTNNGNWYNLTRCAATCEYGPHRVLCDPQAPDSDCPMVDIGNGPEQPNCLPSTILPDGYFICRL